MDELIARLEQATGPNRELDHAVETAVLGEWTYYAPEYTASIDAALTLVPEGFNWTVDGFPSGPACASCYLADAGGQLHDGATPAIAICIASLKARQAMANPQRDL